MSTPFDSQFGEDDEPVEPTNDQSGSKLRAWAKEQQALVKTLQRQLAETKAELTARSSSEVFQSLGISEKIRKFYSGEPTKEAIETWWKENADVFGVDPGVGNDPTLSDAQMEHQAAIDNVQQAALIGQDRQGAMTREVMQEARKGLLNKQGATSNDLDAALAKMGVPDMPLMAPQF